MTVMESSQFVGTGRAKSEVKMPWKDGGHPGWIAVLTLWTRNIVWVGVTKGLGIMLPTMQDQLSTQTWIIGWIAAMITAVSGFSAPFAGMLGRQFGSGNVITVCFALIGIAAIAGSFVQTDVQLAFVYTLLSGIGLGVSDVLCKEVVARCFSAHYATAIGISRTGISIGLFVFGPLVQLFLNTYGWRGTMLVMGGISLHGIVCGALMITAGQTSTDYQSLAKEEPASTHQTNLFSCCSTFWKHVVRNFDLQLLRNGSYWSVAIIDCCSDFSYIMWVVYFVSQAQSNGFSVGESGTFVTIAGVANLLAKLFQGPITDRGVISSWGLTVICVTVNSVCFSASSWLTSYWAMMTSACVLLFCDGIVSCQVDVLIKQVLEVDLLAGAFGWMSLKGTILLTALGFLPGWLYDTTGSYTSAFLVIGCIQALALIPLVALRCLKRV